MLYEFLDNEGVVIGIGTKEEFADYVAQGWLPGDATLGGEAK